MISGSYYHGTSSRRLDEILKNGFRLREDWSKWLAVKGVYFVLNRPLVALYFARRAVLLDKEKGYNSDPVVIKVSIEIENERMLNLTTEEGMRLFYKKYLYISEKYGSPKDYLTLNDPSIRSIFEVHGFSDKEKNDYVNSKLKEVRSYKHFRWDCAVITDLINENKYAIVVALFQEGLSGAFDRFNYKYEDEYIPSYQGIRYRDAIMVCVTDLNCIGKEFEKLEKYDYEQGYIDKVSCIEDDRI